MGNLSGWIEDCRSWGRQYVCCFLEEVEEVRPELGKDIAWVVSERDSGFWSVKEAAT